MRGLLGNGDELGWGLGLWGWLLGFLCGIKEIYMFMRSCSSLLVIYMVFIESILLFDLLNFFNFISFFG
jgi:hypothetical protein